ncbi:hypothetical protein CJU89_2884 [Yarrowia sp. B02]|nr:hypothetical protein CJU89_2884 [Yarrowia sp. B02]
MSDHIEPVEAETVQEHDAETMEAYRKAQGTILTLSAVAKGIATIDFFKQAFVVEQASNSAVGWLLFAVSLVSELDRFGQSLRDNMYVISKEKFYSNETPVSWQEQLFGQFTADTIGNVTYLVFLFYVYKISTSWLVTFGIIQLAYVVLAGVTGAYFGIANKRKVE